jgi:hypothetical protein
MSWLQFFASVIQSLAWPAAIVLVVFLLRRSILSVLRHLKRLKYGDMEAEFGEILEEAEDEISELPMPESLPPTLRKEELREINDFSNNSAVFIAWLEVESAVLNLARTASLLDTNMPASMAAQLLLNRELIDQPTYRAIRELMYLRNIAVHPSDGRVVSRSEAERFRKLADKVAAALEDRKQIVSRLRP